MVEAAWKKMYPAKYYDKVFAKGYGGPEVGPYDGLYKWVLDVYEREFRDKFPFIDIACGPGYLLKEGANRGIVVDGLDFSEQAILRAQKLSPNSQTYLCDVSDAGEILKKYQCFSMTEFLEHYPNDVGFLGSLPSGSVVIASVPNKLHRSHVRYFTSKEEVTERYSPVFKDFNLNFVWMGKYCFYGTIA